MIRVRDLSPEQRERLGQEQVAGISLRAGRPSFEDGSVCSQVDPEMWFPEDGHPAAGAIALCDGCPVRAWCRMYAIERADVVGVWGGMSTRPRQAMRRTHPRLDPDRTTQPRRRPETTPVPAAA